MLYTFSAKHVSYFLQIGKKGGGDYEKCPNYNICCLISGTGKTTFLEKLIPGMKAKELRVAVIKHDGHDFQMDTPGTNTDCIANVSADAVAIVSDYRFTLLEQRPHSCGAYTHTCQSDMPIRPVMTD